MSRGGKRTATEELGTPRTSLSVWASVLSSSRTLSPGAERLHVAFMWLWLGGASGKIQARLG